MEKVTGVVLASIFQRRAVKVFEPVEISDEMRVQILNAACHAPSSFNMQPYRFYWVATAARKTAVAKLCLGQTPAETASALAVAVADIGSLSATSQSQLEWWATKSTLLACENLMIAAEALGLNTCPMEGFDGRRLSRFLELSGPYHEIVMVIAIGEKSQAYVEPPQWRRPLDATVTIL
jgi:nitroreductase